MKKYILICLLGLVLIGGTVALWPRSQAAAPDEGAQPSPTPVVTETPAPPEQTVEPEPEQTEEPEPEEDKPLLVNATHPVEDGDTADMVRVYDYMTDSYWISGMDVYVMPELILPLNEMMDAFYNETGLKTVIVTSGYRSYELQQALFEEKAAEVGEQEAERWVARPGTSEHHTGLAIDLGLYFEEDGSSAEFDGSGEYAWFAEHAPEYGFILRYPPERSDITGIAHEPWHFRYVGVEHAQAITEAGLTLEEYVLG